PGRHVYAARETPCRPGGLLRALRSHLEWPRLPPALASPRARPSAHRLGADSGKPDQMRLFRQVHGSQTPVVLGENADLHAGGQGVGREDPEAFLKFLVRPTGRAKLAPVAVG